MASHLCNRALSLARKPHLHRLSGLAEEVEAHQVALSERAQPADGLDYEVCFGSGDKMKVSIVWDSKEQLDALVQPFGLDGARLLRRQTRPQCLARRRRQRVRRQGR